MDDLHKLSLIELEKLLVSLNEELEEIDRERLLTFAGNVHIGAKEAERLRNVFEKEIQRAEAKKAKVEEELKKRGLRD